MQNTLQQKKQLLLVEDDATNAFVIRKFLESNFDIKYVTNANSAIEALKTQTIDAVLMDINLGDEDIDGIQTLKMIRKMPQNNHLPVIAVTAYAMMGDKERFLKEGFNDYVAKPVEKMLLISTISKQINN